MRSCTWTRPRRPSQQAAFCNLHRAAFPQVLGKRYAQRCFHFEASGLPCLDRRTTFVAKRKAVMGARHVTLFLPCNTLALSHMAKRGKRYALRRAERPVRTVAGKFVDPTTLRSTGFCILRRVCKSAFRTRVRNSSHRNPSSISRSTS